MMANLLSTPHALVLINLYKAHESLWNVHNRCYKSKYLKDVAYVSIQTAFGSATGISLTVPEIKKKLKSYRTQFTKELKLMERSRRNGEEKVYHPRYHYFDKLLFLQPVCSRGLSTATLDYLQNERQGKNEGDSADSSVGAADVGNPLTEDGLGGVHGRDNVDTVSSDSQVSGCVESDTCESVAASPSPVAMKVRQKNVQVRSRAGTHPTNAENAFQASDINNDEDCAYLNTLGKCFRTVTAESERQERRRLQDERWQREIDRQRREERQRNEDVNKPMVIWARALANDIDSMKNVRKKQLLRLQINTLVNEALMEDLPE